MKPEAEESGEQAPRIVTHLSERERERMEVIQELLAAPDKETYRERERSAAKRLNLSVIPNTSVNDTNPGPLNSPILGGFERFGPPRLEVGGSSASVSFTNIFGISSIQRLVRSWKKEGIAVLSWRERSDRGQHRISKDWQEFIVKTYREGNRGSRSMSPAQVAVRVKVRAAEKGLKRYPSHMTVYRILKPLIEQAEQPKRSQGWRGSRLVVKTREGGELGVEWSNQVWQADHTQVDVLVVDQAREVLGRPWLSIVVDSYSRCIMGLHLGFGAPSAWVVCLALRHAILPKQYSSSYELRESWGTYGLPQYLYTDQGKDFTSQHLEQVATELGIGLCSRPQPSEGGIVERPFGTLNREFFSSLPGYVGSNAAARSPVAEREASLTLLQLEKLLVRYIVERYNQGIDARMGDQTRVGRWEAGLTVQLPLLRDRELDLCLMRRERRRVYRGGYLQFANLSYRGEHLAGYSGEEIIIRYNPRDITTVLVYQQDGKGERFVARAHATGLETETMSYREAQAIAQRLRKIGKAITNESMLFEVRDRDAVVEQLRREKRRKRTSSTAKKVAASGEPAASVSSKGEPALTTPVNQAVDDISEGAVVETEETIVLRYAQERSDEAIVVEEEEVHDYEEWKRDYGKWW